MATAYQGRLGRVRIRQESSYGTDMTGTMGSWADLPVIIDTVEDERLEDIVQPGHIIQRLDQRDAGVPMPREASRSFTTNLNTFGTKAAAGVEATQHALGLLLECGLGGKHISTGTTVNGGSATTTVIPLTSAASYKAGCGIGFATGTGGAIEYRIIESISTNTVTLKMALSSAPANAAVAYGTVTYYLHNHPNGADPTYLQSTWEGYHPKDRWVYPGGALKSFAFEGLEPKAIPRIKWGWQHPMWGPADGSFCSANLRSATLAQVAYTDVNLSTVRASDLRLRDVSAATLPSFLNAPKIEVVPSIEYEPLMTPGGGSGLCANSNCFGYRRVEVYEKPVVQLNLDVHWANDTTLDDYHANSTLLGFTQQIGNSVARGGVLIEVSRTQMMKPPKEIKINGIRGKSLQLFAMHDTECVAAAEADEPLAQAALRIVCG